MLSSPRPSQRGAVIAVFAVALLFIAAALLTRHCSRQTPVPPTIKSYMVRPPADTETTSDTTHKVKKKRKKPARKHRKETRRDKSAGHHSPPAQRNPLDETI